MIFRVFYLIGQISNGIGRLRFMLMGYLSNVRNYYAYVFSIVIRLQIS